MEQEMSASQVEAPRSSGSFPEGASDPRKGPPEHVQRLERARSPLSQQEEGPADPEANDNPLEILRVLCARLIALLPTGPGMQQEEEEEERLLSTFDVGDFPANLDESCLDHEAKMHLEQWRLGGLVLLNSLALPVMLLLNDMGFVIIVVPFTVILLVELFLQLRSRLLFNRPPRYQRCVVVVFAGLVWVLTPLLTSTILDLAGASTPDGVPNSYGFQVVSIILAGLFGPIALACFASIVSRQRQPKELELHGNCRVLARYRQGSALAEVRVEQLAVEDRESHFLAFLPGQNEPQLLLAPGETMEVHRNAQLHLFVWRTGASHGHLHTVNLRQQELTRCLVCLSVVKTGLYLASVVCIVLLVVVVVLLFGLAGFTGSFLPVNGTPSSTCLYPVSDDPSCTIPCFNWYNQSQGSPGYLSKATSLKAEWLIDIGRCT